MIAGRIVAINVSNGGLPKTARRAGRIGPAGVEGDRQRNLRYHGGPDRAVCLYSQELIAALRDEGHPIVAGAIGENLTVSGLDWSALVPGTRLRVGAALLQLTSFAAPCRNIAGAFADGVFDRVSHMRHAGWSRLYARVLEAGLVVTGDTVCIVEDRDPVHEA